jgi:sulfoxide reductase heme-binding subunit YedZ
VAVLSLTYYLRRRIGARRWRLAHRFIPIAWALAAVHVIGAGTDAVSLWLDIPVALTIALTLALLAERQVVRRARAAPARGAPATPAVEREAPPEDRDVPAPLWSRAARPS